MHCLLHGCGCLLLRLASSAWWWVCLGTAQSVVLLGSGLIDRLIEADGSVRGACSCFLYPASKQYTSPALASALGWPLVRSGQVTCINFSAMYSFFARVCYKIYSKLQLST